MQLKQNKYEEEVELKKMKENKLNFLLYVLKEEKKIPIEEVEKEYLTPIDTTRFNVNTAEDYQKILERIKENKKKEAAENKI